MKKMAAGVSLLLFVSAVWAQQSASRSKSALNTTEARPVTPEALQAEIEALKPAKHIWREIQWKTCPLEALKEAREQNKPLIAWVFLGIPTDERC